MATWNEFTEASPELAATVGQYQYISAINNAFELAPAAEADQLPI